MTRNRIGNQIEDLIRHRKWRLAQARLEKQLDKEPDDHWLWARLSGVKYEQRDYPGALEAAERALAIIPDCPLALWSKAGAVEMLGKADEAIVLYSKLLQRGLEQLNDPDEDANECWEGPDWTSGLVADCMFRMAGCLAKRGRRDSAVNMYQAFLSLPDMGIPAIYSREDALARLNKLVPSKRAKREAAMRRVAETKKALIAG